MPSGFTPGSPNGAGAGVPPPVSIDRSPFDKAVMNAGHWDWIAMPTSQPAIGAASPPLPLICVALLAKLLPGWTSMGQIDVPTCAMAELIGPLLPIPTLLSTVEPESPLSACARVGHNTVAAMSAADTRSGRSTTADAAMTSTALTPVRPVFGLTRRVGFVRRWNVTVVMCVLPFSPAAHAHHQAQISLW